MSVCHDARRLDYEVVIVGAGISGINAAFYLQRHCVPNQYKLDQPSLRWTVLERRATFGGTWDLFKYPGVRSDSDMYTFSFPFHPWTKEYKYASAQEITDYMKETMEKFGIDKKIKYNTNILSASWSDRDGFWTLTMTKDYSLCGSDSLEAVSPSEVVEIRTQFLILGTGYFDYRDPHWPHWPGEQDKFKGTIMHPQFWDPSYDYRGKKVVVCGSGATAITIVPAVAAENGAKHVTMLQRSPTYMISLPPRGPVVDFFLKFKRFLPWYWLAHLIRLVLIAISAFGFWFSQTFPDKARRGLIGGIAKQLGKENRHLMPHFEAKYSVWSQRVCVQPDGDFIEAIKSGKASIVTDEIDHFEEHGIKLKSGDFLACDLFVPATGLKLQTRGGMKMFVNGIETAPADAYIYRGSMFVDVPNLFAIMGYFTSSWTLRASLIAEYAAKMIAHCRRNKYQVVVPRVSSKADAMPIHEMTSGYLIRGQDQMPRQGSKWPYRMESNWLWDSLLIGFAPMNDTKCLEFRK